MLESGGSGGTEGELMGGESESGDENRISPGMYT